ncbi:GNAT family N-acetyltransferase [Halobacillus locisalis]|nr:GNAT family protein [Halobacillus locisalis]
MGITVNQLEYEDEKALFDFEKENRIYSETMVPSRGEDYYDFDTFMIRHRQLLDEQLEGEAFFFLIRNSDGNILGRMNVVDIDSSRTTGHIGYRVGKQHTGKGVAAEALHLFMKRLKNDGFTKVFAKTTTHNVASQRVLEKNGFIKEEVSEETFDMNGQTFRFISYIGLLTEFS